MSIIELPTGAQVYSSAAYPDNWKVQQAISEVYNSYGVMTYCKPKTLRKFGETFNADTDVRTTVARFYNDEVNETFSTTNDITHVVSSNDNDVQRVSIEGHRYDTSNRKIFVSQQVTLTGQTPVELPTPLCRATRYKISPISFGNEPADMLGNISVYVGEGTTVTNGVIATGQDSRVKLYGTTTNQSRKGATSISYYDFYVITDVGIAADKSSGNTAKIDYDVEYRQEGGVWLPMGIEGRLDTADESKDGRISEPYLFITPNDCDVRPIVVSDADNVQSKFYMNGFLLNDINDPNSTLPEATKNSILQSIRAS